jgi:hypothetical protein
LKVALLCLTESGRKRGGLPAWSAPVTLEDIVRRKRP